MRCGMTGRKFEVRIVPGYVRQREGCRWEESLVPKQIPSLAICQVRIDRIEDCPAKIDATKKVERGAGRFEIRPKKVLRNRRRVSLSHSRLAKSRAVSASASHILTSATASSRSWTTSFPLLGSRLRAACSAVRPVKSYKLKSSPAVSTKLVIFGPAR